MAIRTVVVSLKLRIEEFFDSLIRAREATNNAVLDRLQTILTEAELQQVREVVKEGRIDPAWAVRIIGFGCPPGKLAETHLLVQATGGDRKSRAMDRGRKAWRGAGSPPCWSSRRSLSGAAMNDNDYNERMAAALKALGTPTEHVMSDPGFEVHAGGIVLMPRFFVDPETLTNEQQGLLWAATGVWYPLGSRP